MTTLDYIRLVGKEFNDFSDDDLGMWIEFCEPFVSKKLFGVLYERALALMVCHKMKIIGATSDFEGGSGSSSSSLGNIDDMLRVSSYSEGGVSISYSVNGQSMSNDKNGDLSLTIYGIQYLRLKQACIVPIRISGEGHHTMPLTIYDWC